MSEVIAFVLGTFGTGLGIILLLFFYPDKVQQWGAMIGYTLSKFGGIFKSLHKTAVRLDLQGYINDYVGQFSKDLPFLESKKVKVEFIDQSATRKSLLEDGSVILRLRKDDSDELNFVHGAYMFVSTSLLYKVKRYISQSQRDALDLYITTQLIEKEKPSIRDHFLEEYLHPNLKDPKSERSLNYKNISTIDDGGLFHAVLLEELEFLGSKVFGNNKDDRIISEVRGLMEFLVKVTQRKVGQENTDLNFEREFCRSAILIVGKATTILTYDKTPYVNYIRDILFKKNKIETIYILGGVEKKDIIDDVCNQVSGIYQIIRKRNIKNNINREDGTKKKVDTYCVVLRQFETHLYQQN